jgi:hypothetical protein
MEQGLLEEAGDPDRTHLLDHGDAVAAGQLDVTPAPPDRGELRAIDRPMLYSGLPSDCTRE